MKYKLIKYYPGSEHQLSINDILDKLPGLAPGYIDKLKNLVNEKI